MKTIVIVFILATAPGRTAYSQEDENAWFDFWLGEWEVTWKETDGTTGRGTNSITKILDNMVIQENFKIDEGTSKGYLGTSLSVYNARKRTWYQGYADNKGAYFSFIGERQGEKKIFKTDMVISGGQKNIQRMVFYDIKENSLVWDWESSEDGGNTWKLNWRINYRRKAD